MADAVVMLLIGLVVGTSFGIIVMALLAGDAYERGAADNIELLAKRRRAR
jgi:hypothetical protein